jgi:hypothetical protein
MFKGEEGRRCQGGGLAPPQYRTPREEERVPNVVGPCGPETVAAVPGRRLAPPQYRTPREEERVPNVFGPFGPETVAAVPGRRLVPPQYQTTQGRRRGSPEKLGRFAPL